MHVQFSHVEMSHFLRLFLHTVLCDIGSGDACATGYTDGTFLSMYICDIGSGDACVTLYTDGTSLSMYIVPYAKVLRPHKIHAVAIPPWN